MAWQTVVGQPSQLGESPFWHPGEQQLYWVDIPGRKILRVRPASGAVDEWPLPQDPGCIAPALGGGLVIALRDGIYRAHTWRAAGAAGRRHPRPCNHPLQRRQM